MKMLRLDSKVFAVSPQERAGLRDLGFTEIDEINGNTPQEIICHGKDADMVMVTSNYLQKEVIESFSKCRAIIRRGTGCDKIDLKAATEKGIMVVNLPAFASGDVADHAILLMLALARHLPFLETAIERREWVGISSIVHPTRIAGKTLGIIGFGHIGKAIAHRARAFDMKVIDYHRHVNPEIEEACGVTPVSLETLLQKSDFVIISCPQTAESVNMLGEKEFSSMKSTAYLINVGRGAICDEKALAKAVRDGKIAGAGIDVFQHLNMFAPAENQGLCYYDGIPNIITTPHFAAITNESTQESLDRSLKQIKLILEGYFPTACANQEVFEKLQGQYRLWTE